MDDEDQVRQDEQGAMGEPPGPGRSKMENLRRIEGQLDVQRERTDASENRDPDAQDEAPDRPSERPEDEDRT